MCHQTRYFITLKNYLKPELVKQLIETYKDSHLKIGVNDYDDVLFIPKYSMYISLYVDVVDSDFKKMVLNLIKNLKLKM